MTRTIYTALLLLALAAQVLAQENVGLQNIRLSRNGEQVQLSMDVILSQKKAPRNSVVVFTPRLVGQTDSVDFPQIAVYGRNVYYYSVRTGRRPAVGDDAFLIRYKDGPRAEHYARTLGHQPWMDNCILRLVSTEGDGCYYTRLHMADHEGFTLLPPDTVVNVTYPHRVEETSGSVSGQAKIEFVVNRTEIRADFRNNAQELSKVKQTIDEVLGNKAVRVTRYTLHGYASPEGSYSNNVRLAKGRTEALRHYMADQWGVPASQISTDYTPEDWEGFRKYVEEHRDELQAPDAILQLIDTDLEPDAKLQRISSQHPADYRLLLQECFPALRRTDYTVEYDWLERHEVLGEAVRDTVITTHEWTPDDDQPLEDNILTEMRPTRPWLALKTNLLWDAALAPNIELEAQLGRDSRWSIMVEDWFPWYLYEQNRQGLNNKYKRVGHKPYKNAYEVWALGAELRYWLWPACCQNRPTLTGTFLGIYGAGGKYDWERHSEGDQGEFTSLGLTLGHSWVLSRNLNLELSASAGYVGGPKRHYVAEDKFQDNRLIWRYSGRLRYYGPTKLKLSLVWLLGNKPSRKRQQQQDAAPSTRKGDRL